MPIYKTARFEVKPEALEECLGAIRTFIAAVRENEPRTRLYLSLQEQDAPTKFLHYFIFEDRAAEQFHRQTPWVLAFTGALYPHLVSDGVKFLDYDLAATTEG
ncbi:MAG: antibiotic biosynthesis monooxygenase [Chloroflexi bacterium]|nr:antibiotic biosynthesis monooxygenase [Chloroflexota bacterium]